jgi:hypothetical protein
MILTAAGMTEVRTASSSPYREACVPHHVQANLTQIGGPNCSKIKNCHKHAIASTLASDLKGMSGEDRRPKSRRYGYADASEPNTARRISFRTFMLCRDPQAGVFTVKRRRRNIENSSFANEHFSVRTVWRLSKSRLVRIECFNENIRHMPACARKVP